MNTTMTQARTNWQETFRAQRKAISRDVKQFERGLRNAAAIARNSLAKLFTGVHQDIAPQLESIRQRDDFINSGRSLYAEAQRHEVPIAPRKLAKPPLPSNVPMPPNK